MPSARAQFIAIARARLRVLKRRYAHGLSLLAALIAFACAYLSGQSSAASAGSLDAFSAPLARALLAASPLLLLFGSAVLRRALYHGAELRLLGCYPVSSVAVARWRLFEALGLNLALAGLAGLALLAAIEQLGRSAPLGSLCLALLALASGLTVAQAALARATEEISQASPQRVGVALRALSPLALLFAAERALTCAPPGGLRTELEAALTGSRGGEIVLIASACCLAFGSACWWLGSGADRLAQGAAARPPSQPGWPSVALRAALSPLPKALRGLIGRDLSIIARGGFPRALGVLTLLALLPPVTTKLAEDPSLEAWARELLTLLAVVVLATLVSFLCAADLPRHLRGQGSLEASQPVPGRDALRARALLSFLISSPYLLALLTSLAWHPLPELRALVPSAGLKGLLLLGCLCHTGAALGIKAERDRSGVEGGAFPMAMAASGLGLALLGRIHLGLLLLYPWLSRGSARLSEAIYERPEPTGGAP
jgi:hypothetical protein